MSGYLTGEQITQLLKPINPSRVQHLDNLSHLAAYDVRAHLNRIIGFGRWSADVVDVTLLFEDVQLGIERKKRNGEVYKADIVSVGYRATMRLTVCSPGGIVLATYTECAAGDANNFPMTKRADAHDFALKTAESQALKRCATNLGDQFGLSLYENGSTEALVRRTLVHADTPPAGDRPGDVQDGVKVAAEQSSDPSSVQGMEPTPEVLKLRKEIIDAAAVLGTTGGPALAKDWTGHKQDTAPERLGDADAATLRLYLADLEDRAAQTAQVPA